MISAPLWVMLATVCSTTANCDHTARVFGPYATVDACIADRAPTKPGTTFKDKTCHLVEASNSQSQAIAPPQPQALAPACDNYGVELTIERIFHAKYQGSKDVSYMYEKRELSNKSDGRLCSAELQVLPAAMTGKGHEYIKYWITGPDEQGRFAVTLTHEEDL